MACIFKHVGDQACLLEVPANTAYGVGLRFRVALSSDTYDTECLFYGYHTSKFALADTYVFFKNDVVKGYFCQTDDVLDHLANMHRHEPEDCLSCMEDMGNLEIANERCAKSEKSCGHHCNHSWTHDGCCYCGNVFGDNL